jgi:hypothetical protein
MRRTLPKYPSAKTTVISPIPYLRAVDSSCRLQPKPPSPLIATTGTSGRATFAPRPAGKP